VSCGAKASLRFIPLSLQESAMYHLEPTHGAYNARGEYLSPDLIDHIRDDSHLQDDAGLTQVVAVLMTAITFAMTISIATVVAILANG